MNNEDLLQEDSEKDEQSVVSAIGDGTFTLRKGDIGITLILRRTHILHRTHVSYHAQAVPSGNRSSAFRQKESFLFVV
jgi:hypothetical protein